MSDLLLRGLSLLLIEGRTAGVPVLQQAAVGFAGEQASSEEALKWGWLAMIAANLVYDYDSCLAVASRNVQLARETGALAVLAIALQPMSQASHLRATTPGQPSCWRRRTPSAMRRVPSCCGMALCT